MSIYIHTPESYGECTAVKWRGDNLEEVKGVFPEIKFEISDGSLWYHKLDGAGSRWVKIITGDYLVDHYGNEELKGFRSVDGGYFEDNYKLKYGFAIKFNKKFREDLASPLNEIERPWLRRTALIISAPFIFVAMGALSAVLWTRQLFEDCW